MGIILSLMVLMPGVVYQWSARHLYLRGIPNFYTRPPQEMVHSLREVADERGVVIGQLKRDVGELEAALAEAQTRRGSWIMDGGVDAADTSTLEHDLEAVRGMPSRFLDWPWVHISCSLQVTAHPTFPLFTHSTYHCSYLCRLAMRIQQQLL